jgi:hypothetical protein
MKNQLLIFVVFCMASPVCGVIISADADGYSEGTNISTAFAGMTLSSVGRAAGLDGIVYAYDSPLASTGTSVFGHNLANHTEWYFDAYPAPYHPDDFALRVDFDQPANMVSVDLICNSSFDYARITAYDSFGSVLRGAYSGQLTYGQVFPATIRRDSFDIAYIIAGGMYTNSATPVLLDNLTANVIPEPCTFLLLALGSLALLRKRKA